jgi:hypothetical protein
VRVVVAAARRPDGAHTGHARVDEGVCAPCGCGDGHRVHGLVHHRVGHAQGERGGGVQYRWGAWCRAGREGGGTEVPGEDKGVGRVGGGFRVRKRRRQWRRRLGCRSASGRRRWDGCVQQRGGRSKTLRDSQRERGQGRESQPESRIDTSSSESTPVCTSCLSPAGPKAPYCGSVAEETWFHGRRQWELQVRQSPK